MGATPRRASERAAEPALPLPWQLTDPAARDPVERHHVGLEPRQAWRLKGLGGEMDEVVIPGLLLDDLGRSRTVEASMAFAVFCELQAMASVAELRMVEERRRPRPGRTRAEANVWLVDALRAGRRLKVMAVVSLDRVVFAPERHLCADTLRRCEIVPGDKAWR